MSAFLGPIHYWLFKKIKLQEELTITVMSELLSASEQETMRATLDRTCGTVETRPLEDCIDTQNIHGWLQGQGTIAEARFALLVTTMLQVREVGLNQIQQVVYEVGAQNPISALDAQAIFQTLNDILLDGMPCDHVNEVLEQTPERVLWKQTRCLHSEYWARSGGDVRNYYVLRSRWIAGMLANGDFEYAETDGTYSIRRKETV